MKYGKLPRTSKLWYYGAMFKASILIVDDHPVFVKGFAQLIESQADWSSCGTAANSREALRIVEKKQPDCVIVDLNLGEEDGLALIRDIQRCGSTVRILVFSMHDERFYSERALKLGAHGYVMKHAPIEEVFDAIRTVLRGEIWLSNSERQRLSDYLEDGRHPKSEDSGFTSIQDLSTRQLQIFTLIGKGAGTVEIAAQLQLSRKTVDTHKENIKQKLRCASVQEVRQLAIEWVRL